MYSVIRFVTDSARVDALHEVGREIDACRPGTVVQRRDGFVCDLSDHGSFPAHAKALREFVHDFDGWIRAATSKGATVTADVAIEPDDVGSVRFLLGLHLEADLMAQLGACDVAFEVSIYRGPDASDDDTEGDGVDGEQ